MKYPSDWQKIEEAGVKAFRERNGMAVFAIYTDPVELPQIITKNPNLLQLQLAEDKKATTESLTNSRVIESNMTTIDGNPASKLVSLRTENIEGQDITLRFIQLDTIKNDTRYSFMVAISPASYDEMLPIVQK